ncbi:MAG: hypothetical protein ACXQT3_00350, partial [Methermicoccaceae archaeon]
MSKRRRYIRIPAPTLGLHYDAPSTLIDSRATPECTNITFKYGVLSKSAGARDFADTGTTPLTGAVMLIDAASDEFFVHTTTHFYIYDSTTDTFDDHTRSSGAYTGSEDDVWSSVFMANLYIFSNGKDEVQKWDPTSPDYAANLTNATTYLPKWLLYFGERLV